MYDIANEEAAMDEFSYQSEFLSIFFDEMSSWEEYGDNRLLQDMADAFANASIENDISPEKSAKLFKTFYSLGLKELIYKSD